MGHHMELLQCGWLVIYHPKNCCGGLSHWSGGNILSSGNMNCYRIWSFLSLCKNPIWQESHRNDDRCVSSWFRSHPAGPYPWDWERTMDPYQARPFLAPHISLNDIVRQAHPLTSPMTAHTFNQTSHITPQGHIIIKSYSEKSPVGLLMKSTGNRPRTWVQE